MTDPNPIPPDPNAVPPTTPPTQPAGAVGYDTTVPKGPLYTGPAPDKDAVTMGMLCHLLGIFTAFLGPLIIWLIKKDQSPFVDDQGKEALNFQITCLIAGLVCVPLIPVFCIGGLLGIAVQIFRIVFSIIGTVEANKGVAYRYPLTLRLVK